MPHKPELSVNEIASMFKIIYLFYVAARAAD
jgi:hypothetical protein